MWAYPDWGGYFAAALVDALKARREEAARLPALEELEQLERGLRHVVDGGLYTLRPTGGTYRSTE